MTKAILGAILSVGLCLSGCGGPETQADQATQGAATHVSATPVSAMPHVSTGVRCSDKDWQDIFWSDATHTVQVGSLTCRCFQLEDLEGVESNFITLAYEDTCDLR